MLSDGAWHTSEELAQAQNRFGSSLLILKKGDYDEMSWVIEKARADRRQWQYRLVCKTKEKYVPASPTCLDCGSHRVLVRDDRK